MHPSLAPGSNYFVLHATLCCRCQAATRVPTTQYVTFGGMNRTEVNEFYFGDMAAAVILLDGADSAASQARNWTTLVEAGYYANVTGNGPFFPASPLTGDALSSECLGPCVDFSVTSIDGDYESTLDPNCPTAACAPYSAVSPLTCSQYAKSSCVANCYCWAQLRQLGEELGYIQALWQMVGADGAQSNSSDAGLCSDVVLAVARNSGLMWGAVIALASVNIIMTVILKRLSRFERYSNAGEENRANLLKVRRHVSNFGVAELVRTKPKLSCFRHFAPDFFFPLLELGNRRFSCCC